MKKLCSILLALMATTYLASTALASPVQLLTDQVTKMKFTDYEKLIDNNNNGLIDAGDQFEGVLTLSTISNVDSTVFTWTGAGSDEITGHFLLTVLSTDAPLSSTSPPSGTVNVKFTMGSNDYLNMYYDTTQDYSAGISTNGATDVANATDGALYFSVQPGDYVDGGNVTTPSASTNYNWANLTTNNTGYIITPELWKDAAGVAGNYGSLISQIYFETQISYVAVGSNAAQAGWMYKSEDPLYLNAVPEPATMTLFGLGLLFGGAGIKRRRNSLK